MNKKEFIALIAEETGLTQKKTNEVIDCCCDLIGRTLKNRESIRLVGFGTFATKEKASRVGKNPRTGEQMFIPATVVPIFKAGKSLKEKVYVE